MIIGARLMMKGGHRLTKISYGGAFDHASRASQLLPDSHIVRIIYTIINCKN